MDIGKYRALLRTVEMGNITRAAEELDVYKRQTSSRPTARTRWWGAQLR